MNQQLAMWFKKPLLIYTLLGIMIFITICLSLVLVTQLLPQTIKFSYAKPISCITSPQLFPGLFSAKAGASFRLSAHPIISIGHWPLLANEICAEATRAPGNHTTSHLQLALDGQPFTKQITVTTATYPQLAPLPPVKQPLKLSQPLQLQLTQLDTVFSYAVMVNGKSTSCTARSTTLSCDLQPLRLSYGTAYTLHFERLFKQKVVGTVLIQSITTISAVSITNTSIAAGSVVQNSPSQLVLSTNKLIHTLGALNVTAKSSSGTSTAIRATATYKQQTIVVTFAEPLPRKSNITVSLASLTATDTSGLEEPYNLSFATSGGPRVASTNIGSYDVVANQAITVSFDQNVNPHQNPNSYISVAVNGVKQTTQASLISANKISIAPPASGYPLCATVVIQVSNSVQNLYGIAGDSAWSRTALSRCYTTFSIGTSVQGRAITAYKFGSGPSLLLYIAAMHGDENNTANLMQKWINDLNANPQLTTTSHTIVVIPQINPDGVAAHTRVNAHNIDLNRNFPSNSWQTVVTEPNGASMPAGGPTPLSEPESQALANYILATRPRLVLTYHSHAGIVEANDAGDSISLAAKYAKLAHYQAIPTYAIGSTFDYSTSGAMEDWMNDKLNLPAFVIELTSATADEFSQNQPAMRAMTQI